MMTLDEVIRRYEKLGQRLGDIIPSDAQLSELWGVTEDSLFEARTVLRKDYQYANLPNGNWQVVFAPRNGLFPPVKVDETQQALDKYIKDFTEYLEAASPQTDKEFKAAKGEARTYALSNLPTKWSAAYSAYQAWLTRNITGEGNKEPWTELETLGHRINLASARVCKAILRRQSAPKPPKLLSKPPKSTCVDVYEAWCEAHRWVPSDLVLAHFSGVDQSSYSRSRKALIAKGYKFERSGHGWDVAKPERWTDNDEAQLQATLRTLQQAEELRQKLIAKKGRT